jgi:hypothetical protein
VAIHWIDGRPAIETSEGELVLDSGTDAVLLRRAAAGQPEKIRTAAGSAAGQTVRDLQIIIGSQRYRPAITYFVPLSPLLEGGQLPACLFRSLYISNSAGYIVLNPGSAR